MIRKALWLGLLGLTSLLSCTLDVTPPCRSDQDCETSKDCFAGVCRDRNTVCPSPTRPCYPTTLAGCADTENSSYRCIGLCKAGSQSCKDGVWSDCKGFIAPAFEIVGDNKDNNCNGQIDELTLRTGRWRLSTASQAKARWDIFIQTDAKTNVQYVACLQFKFSLTHPVTRQTYNITQWQSAMPPERIPVQQNGLLWSLNEANKTLKISWKGSFFKEDGVTGTISIVDTDPSVGGARAELAFVGSLEAKAIRDGAEVEFCNRCPAACPWR